MISQTLRNTSEGRAGALSSELGPVRHLPDAIERIRRDVSDLKPAHCNYVIVCDAIYE